VSGRGKRAFGGDGDERFQYADIAHEPANDKEMLYPE
jgi:hypothetical protein